MGPKCLTFMVGAFLSISAVTPQLVSAQGRRVLPLKREIHRPPEPVRPPIPPTPAPHPVQPRSPEIFFCETADAACRTTQDTFSIDDLRDLYVFVAWPGATGPHVQTVQFFLPNGDLYLSRDISFTRGGGSEQPLVVTTRVRQVGPPRPAPQFTTSANLLHSDGIRSLLFSTRGDTAVLTVLPVGGTYITQRNLTGTWQVRVLLDDQSALQSSFTLNSRPVPPAAAAQEAQ